MKTTYKIEIVPHYHLTKTFWCVLGNDGGDWYNAGAGWANSAEEAFNEAYAYYQKYYCM